jgi:hypothetical protein
MLTPISLEKAHSKLKKGYVNTNTINTKKAHSKLKKKATSILIQSTPEKPIQS